jgi:LacI family transcriptional regulator
MRSSQVTIKDIASQLGISPSTVSRALKDHPDISERTKKAVKELANILGYKPNEIALSLRTSKTNIIGLIIPEIEHHFFSSVINGIEAVASLNGYNVMIFQSNEKYTREVINTQTLLSHRVDGVLLSVSKETQNYSHMENLIKNSIPIVLFDRVIDELPVDKVIVDDYRGAYEATEHMIQKGCKKIIHLASQDKLSVGMQRRRGYTDAMIKHKLFKEEYVVHAENLEESKKAVTNLLNKKYGMDGIFAVNDLSAIGAMQAIRKKGLKIPKDIAVVGFTNSLSGQFTEPALSTVDQQGYKLGEQAAQLLLQRMSSKDMHYTPVTKILGTGLVVRASSSK